MKNLRVALLIDTWFPELGGGQINAWEVSKSIVKDSETEIEVFTRNLEAKGALPEMPKNMKGRLHVRRLGPRGQLFNWPLRLWWMMVVVWEVMKEHRSNPFDVIHAHAMSAIIPGRILTSLFNVPLVLTIHGVNVTETKPNSIMARIEKRLLLQTKADWVISVQHNYQVHAHIHKGIVTVIPNGVDWEDFEKIQSSKKGLKFSFIWIGRFDPIKGLSILVEAFAHIAEKHMDIVLQLVGEGTDRKRIAHLVKELGVEHLVMFTGKVLGKEKVRLMKQADVLLLPSLSEGQPLVILEAAAARLPVIASRTGDVPQMVVDGKNGWLIKPGSKEDLIRAMNEAIKERDQLKNKGNSLYKGLVNKYSWQKAGKETLKVYSKIRQDD